MAEEDVTNNDDNQYGSESTDGVKLEQSAEETYKQSETSDNVRLILKQNRHKELHIKRKIYHFFGAGYSLDVPKTILDSDEFQSQKKYFTIKEI